MVMSETAYYGSDEHFNREDSYEEYLERKRKEVKNPFHKTNAIEKKLKRMAGFR